MIERRTVSTQNELRDAYNRLFAEAPVGEKPRFYRWILSLFETPGPPPTLLDIACGTGGMLEAARDTGWTAIGCDLSDQALELARKRGVTNCLLADGEALPLPDAAFSAVTHLGNLEHFLDPAAGAREVRRVLAPGGRAIIMLPNSYYSGDLWRLIRTGYGPNHHQAIDRFATLNEWRDLLAEAGLQVQKVIAYNKFKWWKKLLPKALAYHFVYVCTR